MKKQTKSLLSNKLTNRYKAIIFDVDGTLIPNKFEGMPSQQVKNAIQKAAKKIHIGVATSRCFPVTNHIIDSLKLSGPSILCGGGVIMDVTRKKMLWNNPIQKNDLKFLCNLLTKFHLKFYMCNNENDKPYSKNYSSPKTFMIFLLSLKERIADKIIKEISHLSSITAHKVPDWKDNKITLTLSSSQSTKQHGILKIAKLLGIQTHEIIGVGDGYNDFPLLMACGLKVAMGNAVEDIKAIADYIAPPVEEDGAAHIIEKFVL